MAGGTDSTIQHHIVTGLIALEILKSVLFISLHFHWGNKVLADEYLHQPLRQARRRIA